MAREAWTTGMCLAFEQRLARGCRPEFANHHQVGFSCVFAYVLIQTFTAEVPRAALVGVAVF